MASKAQETITLGRMQIIATLRTEARTIGIAAGSGYIAYNVALASGVGVGAEFIAVAIVGLITGGIIRRNTLSEPCAVQLMRAGRHNAATRFYMVGSVTL